MKPWEQYQEGPWTQFSSEAESSALPWEQFGGEMEKPEQDGAAKAAGAAMDFVESGLGIGDELGAIGTGIGGSVYDLLNTDKSLKDIVASNFNWERNIQTARETLDTFEEQNPALSGAITAAGIGGSLLIPGAGAVKLAQTGSVAARAAKIGGLSAAEGAAYGLASGRDEGRLDSAVLGAVIGGSAGIGVSMLLRNNDEIAKMAQADEAVRTADETHIGGKGWAEVADNRPTRDVSKASESAANDRKIREVVTDEDFAGQSLDDVTKATGFFGNWFGDVTRWTRMNVGERAARLVQDAEWMGKAGHQEWITKVEDNLAGFDDLVESNEALGLALQNMGRGKKGTTWEDAYKAVRGDKAATEKLRVFENLYADLKKLDSKSRTTYDWIHTSKKAGTETGEKGTGRLSDYMGPARAMLEYADEVVTANAVAERFGLMMNDITVKKGQPIMEAVMAAVKKEAKTQGASDAVANNLEDVLRTVFVASKAGGDAAGAIARKVSSTAMLGSPMNAILNMSEWLTPAFQSGLKDWATQVPGMIKYALGDLANEATRVGKYGTKFNKDSTKLTPENIGLGDQWMGEVASEAEKTFGSMVDRLGKFIYSKSGVTTSNKVGQYAQINSAVNRGRSLANKVAEGGKSGAKAMEKLRRTDGMRGLSEAEIDKTIQALRAGDMASPWVKNYAGASINMWMPVSSSALPKAFSDHPNGRMAYSMLTYMNRQANGMKVKIGDELTEAYKRGLNTEEGRAAMRRASANAARYIAYYGVIAGVWERFRTSLDPSRDIELDEVFTPEGVTEATIAQIASNMTSGLVDVRADEYGKNQFDPTPAPLDYIGRVGTGLYAGATGMLTGNESDMKEFGRMLQGDVPGIATADKIKRMTMDGERLLVQPEER